MENDFIDLGSSPKTGQRIYSLPWGQTPPASAPVPRLPYGSEVAVMFKTAAMNMPVAEIPVIDAMQFGDEDDQVVLETSPCPPDLHQSEWVWAESVHHVHGTDATNVHTPLIYQF